jgi:hypothetical protein
MATIQNSPSTTYSLTTALLTSDVPNFNPLAPGASPLTMLGDTEALALDDRLPSNMDAQLMAWLRMDESSDPELSLPGPFMAAFKEAREQLTQLAKDPAMDAETTKDLRQALRWTQEYESNKDLAFFYTNSVQKG